MTASAVNRLALWLMAWSCATASLGADGTLQFDMNPSVLTPPPGMTTIGDSHGDIAVSPAGEVYVSVQAGERPGVQVYSPQGHYLRNVPNAPNDLHGFVIATAPDGTLSIFGVRRLGQMAIRLTLDGRITLTIPATSIPDRYKTTEDGKPPVHLTGIAVADNGDILVVDGYGRDFIHRFDKEGRYLSTFGGQGPPWNFNQCHKIALDPRFTPVRLLCADRLHGRVVSMDLKGHILGVVAEGLRWPSALAVYKNELAVAEAEGRVTILGLKGERLASIGTNDNADEVKTNQISPERWKPDLFYAPHGIAYGPDGRLWVTEWNQWGRVVLVDRR